MKQASFTRREIIHGAGAAGLATALAGWPIGAGADAALPFDSPEQNVRTMARLTSTLEPGKTGFVRYRGKAFALLEDGRNLPLYDIDGVAALRAEPRDGGAIRFLFNEFAVYLEPGSGRPLERWANPITGRDVEVWHLRNGPVNYELAPDKASFGAFTRAGAVPTTGFQLPWVRNGPFATFALDVTGSRPNPLQPGEWPLESSGAMVNTTEHSQYAVLERDLLNPRLPSLQFFASLQSLKPWHPWMLMGQRPGRIFTRTVAQKVAGPEVLAPTTLAFARANLASWMQAPTSWTGKYMTQQAIYKSSRRPQQ